MILARKGNGQQKKDKAYCEMRRQALNHRFLRKFYESWVPYTKEFEQMHDIIKEELNEVNNARVLGVTFGTLKDYHLAAQKNRKGFTEKTSKWNCQV